MLQVSLGEDPKGLARSSGYSHELKKTPTHLHRVCVVRNVLIDTWT
jgi:hypothetical protein